MGFFRRSVKQNDLHASAIGKLYTVCQPLELRARLELPNMLFNVCAAKTSVGSELAHDYQELANNVTRRFSP